MAPSAQTRFVAVARDTFLQVWWILTVFTLTLRDTLFDFPNLAFEHLAELREISGHQTLWIDHL